MLAAIYIYIYIYIFAKDSGTFKSFHSTTILVASQRSRKFHGMHVSMTEHSLIKLYTFKKHSRTFQKLIQNKHYL